MLELHPRLLADSTEVVRFALCDVRLIRDANYPWVILVPRREGTREIHELSVADQQVLLEELSFVSKALQDLFDATKMNVAALGNMVPQLHIHVVARFESDVAWPGAIWGAAPSKPYSESDLTATLGRIRSALARES